VCLHAVPNGAHFITSQEPSNLASRQIQERQPSPYSSSPMHNKAAGLSLLQKKKKKKKKKASLSVREGEDLISVVMIRAACSSNWLFFLFKFFDIILCLFTKCCLPFAVFSATDIFKPIEIGRIV